MPTITVRDLPDDVQRRLKQRAVSNGRSMEAEVRAILSSVVAERGFGAAWVKAAAEHRGDDLQLPARSAPRDVDFS